MYTLIQYNGTATFLGSHFIEDDLNMNFCHGDHKHMDSLKSFLHYTPQNAHIRRFGQAVSHKISQEYGGNQLFLVLYHCTL